MATTKTIDVSLIIDYESVSRLQWIVVALCCLTAMLDGFDVQAIAFVVPVLAHEWAQPAAAFGTVFGAGLLGLGIGSAGLGPLGDKVGRRKVIIAATLCFGLFSLLTATATSLGQLIGWRFVTGVGLGAVLPNLFALTSEYVPARLRATLVTLMFCGFPAGAVIGGLVSVVAVPQFGWTFVFIAGGVLPILVAGLLYLWLPDSPAFLIAKARTDELMAIMRRLRPKLTFDREHVAFSTSLDGVVTPHVRELFVGRLRPLTVIVWALFFFNLLSTYFLINWLPLVLQQAGFPLNASILGAAILNLGGVIGAVVMAQLVDRTRMTPAVLLAGYLGAALASRRWASPIMAAPPYWFSPSAWASAYSAPISCSPPGPAPATQWRFAAPVSAAPWASDGSARFWERLRAGFCWRPAGKASKSSSSQPFPASSARSPSLPTGSRQSVVAARVVSCTISSNRARSFCRRLNERM